MGLGKTVQTVSVINHLFQDLHIRGPFLIVAPLITVPHWQREFEGWTHMNTLVYHGSAESRQIIRENEFYFPCDEQSGGSNHKKKRKNSKSTNSKKPFMFNVLITTYEMIITDVQYLGNIQWKYLAVDEAHRLKNKNCKLINVLRTFHFDHLLLLTGTPLQNNTEELWTLLNFLDPEKFNSLDEFSEKFGNLTETKQVEDLHTILHPYLLRRMKEDVEKSIAPKEETIIEVELTTIQKKYYRAIFERNFSSLNMGSKASNVPSLLNVMMQLRKCCNHPYLLRGVEDNILSTPRESTIDESTLMIKSSGKLVLIDKLLEKLKAQGHKVLIFSQMVRMLDILEDFMIYRKYSYERIDGSKRGNERQEAIDRFSAPESDRFVFLLCTRAGGLGINLTAADTCIIYDSDWNPQNDIQAQARCHRIGQTQMVKVYRLITHNTYEKKMFEKASKKLGLDQAVLTKMKSSSSSSSSSTSNSNKIPLNTKEVDELLKYGAYGAFDDTPGTDQYDEEDIDKILERSATVIVGGNDPNSENSSTNNSALSSFSKASFVSADAESNAHVDVTDPDFWKKLMPDLKVVDPLVQFVPRKRKQVRRYGNVDTMQMAILEARSESDSEMEEYEETNEEPTDDPLSLGWTTRDRNRLKLQLQTFGFGQWYTVRKAALLERWSVDDVRAYSEILISKFVTFLGEEPEKSLQHLKDNFIPERYAPNANPITFPIRPKSSPNDHDVKDDNSMDHNDGNGLADDQHATSSSSMTPSSDNQPKIEIIDETSTNTTQHPSVLENDLNSSSASSHDNITVEQKTHSEDIEMSDAEDNKTTPTPDVNTLPSTKSPTNHNNDKKENNGDVIMIDDPSDDPPVTNQNDSTSKPQEKDKKQEDNQKNDENTPKDDPKHENDDEELTNDDEDTNDEEEEENEEHKKQTDEEDENKNKIIDFSSETTLRGHEFKEYAKRNAKLLVRRLESIAKASKNTIDCIDLFGEEIQIPEGVTGQVCDSWTSEDDKSLILGTYIHGYNRFAEMRLDPKLSFLRFYDPSDEPVNIQNDPRLKPQDNDDNQDDGNNENDKSDEKQDKNDHKNEEENNEDKNKEEKDDDKSDQTDHDKQQNMEEKQTRKENNLENIDHDNTHAMEEDKVEDSNTMKQQQQPDDNKNEESNNNNNGNNDNNDHDENNDNKELWPEEKILNRRLRKVLRLIALGNEKSLGDGEKTTRKRGDIQKDWTKREKLDFYRVITTHGIRTTQAGQPDWDIFKDQAKLTRKTYPMIAEYCATLMNQSNKAIELGKEYDIQRKHLISLISKTPPDDVPDTMTWLANGDISLSLAQCKRVLQRVKLFKDLNEKILPMKDQLKLKLSDARPSATLPSWWNPSDHDFALILGVVKHGFGQWEKICSDDEFCFYELAKQRLSLSTNSIQINQQLSPNNSTSAAPTTTATSTTTTTPLSDDNHENDDDQNQNNKNSSPTLPKKRKRGRQIEVYTNALDFPKEKMLTKRLDYLIRFLTTPLHDFSSLKRSSAPSKNNNNHSKKQISITALCSPIQQKSNAAADHHHSLLSSPTPLLTPSASAMIPNSLSSRPPRTAKLPKALRQEKLKKEQLIPVIKPPLHLKYTDVVRSPSGEVIFPICIGKMKIESLGNIVFDRNEYHTPKYIWPVGFRSVRTYQSFVNPDERTEFTSEIVDGGDKPIFRVTPADAPDKATSANSATAAWSKIFKLVKNDDKSTKKSSAAVSGPEYFGLARPIIRKVCIFLFLLISLHFIHSFFPNSLFRNYLMLINA